MPRLPIIAAALALLGSATPAWAQWTPYGQPNPYGSYEGSPDRYGSPGPRWEEPRWNQPYGRWDRRVDVDEVARSMQRQSSGSQPGTLVDVVGGELVLRPFDPRAGVAHLELGRGIPAITGNDLVPVEALRPGTPVRVYYQNDPYGRRPRVVGVEVLNR